MRTATGNDAKAIELEYFIKKYKPFHWVVDIQNVVFVPMITSKTYIDLRLGVIPEEFNKPYFIAAINAFFGR